MKTLIISFPDARIASAAEFIDLFWNVNSRGIARGDITADAINQAPIEMFPGLDPPKWGQGAWGGGAWGGQSLAPTIQFETPPVHFGRVRVAGRARDELGNYQAGAMAETTRVVNSTPNPPSRFRRGAYASGRQWFSFIQSPQLEVTA